MLQGRVVGRRSVWGGRLHIEETLTRPTSPRRNAAGSSGQS